MADNRTSNVSNSDGEHKFDRNIVRLGVGATVVGILLFGSLGIVSTVHEGLTWRELLSCLVAFVVLPFAAVHISRLSGRTVRISDDGVWVRDKHGREIGSIHWVELARVTERRRMAQLALWDKSGTRRVLLDQQYENFALIRSRVLAEYAKVFTLKPLPIEFQRSNPVMYEGIVFAMFAGLFGWVAWMAFQQGQRAAGAFFLCFVAAILVSLLNLYPQMRGPSVLYEDRFVLRSLFKTQEVYKKSVRGVEIGDVANPQSGTKFSLVILQIIGGKQLKITSKYGSIPEIYLTFRAWLARP